MKHSLTIDALEVKGEDNYFGLERGESNFADSRFVVIQAGFDGTVTYGKGTAAGPRAIRTASQHVELYDDELDEEVIPRVGVCTLEELDCNCNGEEINRRIYEVARQAVGAGKIPVLIGGEHSVSFGNVKAVWERYPDLSALHFDAHSDLRDSYHGDKFNHACAAARINELCPIVQAGIRSREEMEYGHPERPVHCFPAWKYRRGGPWFEEAVALLSPNVYITVDVDGFDPSVMPGTGTPEPGGLDWWTVIDLIRMTCEKRNVVGFDIVEVAPIAGTQQTQFAAARLMGKMIAYTGRKL